jgi:hypothetical protein
VSKCVSGNMLLLCAGTGMREYVKTRDMPCVYVCTYSHSCIYTYTYTHSSRVIHFPWVIGQRVCSDSRRERAGKDSRRCQHHYSTHRHFTHTDTPHHSSTHYLIHSLLGNPLYQHWCDQRIFHTPQAAIRGSTVDCCVSFRQNY